MVAEDMEEECLTSFLRVFSDLTCRRDRRKKKYFVAYLCLSCAALQILRSVEGKQDQARTVALTVAHQTPRRLVVHGPARRHSAWWCGYGVLVGVAEAAT